MDPRLHSILLILMTAFQAQASLYEMNSGLAAAFYKSPESLFVSGYATKNELLAQIRQSYTEFTFEAAIGNKTIHVSNEQILREINVSWKVKVKKATPLYSQDDLSSPHVMQLKEDQFLDVESIDGAFARVKHASLKKGYVLSSSLEVVDTDPGQWVNMMPLGLKKEASATAKQKILIPALSRLELLKIEDGFGLFKTGSFTGYAAMSDVVGRSDFAEMGWDNQNRIWERVLYRTADKVVVIPNKAIPLKNFTAFKSSRNRALISGEHMTLAKGTRVELVKPQAIRWTQSEIKGHGLVWWRRDLLSETLSIESITTKELLKKNLNGLSYDPKTKKGLASAGGIYRTLDGKTWKKLAYFGNDDWPVLIHPAGAWFVGTYRSTDEGKTFEPSLKFTDLAKLLQNAGTSTLSKSKAFTHLKVIDLEALPKSYMMMKIDTGVSIAKLKSHVLSNNWLLQK